MPISENGAEAVTDSLTAGGSDEFGNTPSGSAALATSSEADPWVARPSGPWNTPDTTSPTLKSSKSGSTPPSHVRTSIPNSQTLLEVHNYTQSRPGIGPAPGFGMSQPKSILDPSSNNFNYVPGRKPSFGVSDDKEISGQYFSNGDGDYDMDITSRSFRSDQLGSHNGPFLKVGGSASRDGSMPLSRALDSGMNGGGLPFGNGNPAFGSNTRTPVHSQHPSYSGSYVSQTNVSRYSEFSEAELRDKFTSLGFGGGIESTSASQNHNSSYSPSHGNLQVNGASQMWNDPSANAKIYQNESFATQPFSDQPYFNRASRFEGASISPGRTDYRRGFNSPKYYSRTPPSEQMYRPSSGGPRMPQVPGELERRHQNVQFSQQQSYFPPQFPGQYPPQAYDYPPPNFRQGNAPYGYMQVPVYTPAQVVPTQPAKDHQDVGVGVRSVLLEEFRGDAKSSKRYDLKVCTRRLYHIGVFSNIYAGHLQPCC